MAYRTLPPEPLLTPGEVAKAFRVDPKTVTRWAKSGILSSFRTPGGHRRFPETEVTALLGGERIPLLTPSEVASIFRVDSTTVTRWATVGKLNSWRTLGGHHRFSESEVMDLLKG